MTKTVHTVVALLLLGAISASGQVQLPWSALTAGGGSSSGSGWTLLSSVGQGTAGRATGSSFALEGGYIPGTRLLSGASTVADVTVALAWNLVSVPVIVAKPLKTDLFPTAVSNAFAYYPPPTGYAARDTLAMGVAYWLKFPGPASIPIVGASVTLDTIPVSDGWNMIGTLSYPVLASEITSVGKIPVLTPAYGFAGGIGYYAEDTLKPGLGYWVKVAGTGQLILRAASFAAPPSQSGSTAHKQGSVAPEELAARAGSFVLSIRDNAGRERKLAVAPESKDLNADRFELPPTPPAGTYDVRFASQRSLAVVDVQGGGRQEFPITIAGAEYPVTVSWEVTGSAPYALEGLSVPGRQAAHVLLQGAGSKTFSKADAAGLKLVYNGKGGAELPTKFALYQNYPNPFNPTTEIAFDVPALSRVSLVVYNLLGEQVAVLLRDEEREQGSYTVQFNAERLSSGLYFYRLQAGDQVQTKKMTLLR